MAASCSDPESSLPTTGQPSLSVLAPFHSDSTFYYYLGQRIALEHTGDAVVLQTDLPDPQTAVRSAFQAEGLTLARLERLHSPGDHWLAHLTGADAPMQERAATALRGIARVRFAQPTYRVAGSTVSFLPTNRVSVQFKSSTTPSQVDSLASSLGLELVRPPRPDSGFFDHAFRYPPGRDVNPLAIAALLDRHTLVQWASPDRITNFQRLYVPSDPFYGLQFHLKNSIFYNGTRVDINAEPAWDVTRGSSTIKLAVIDDGVDADHLDYGYGPGFNGALGYDGMYALGQEDNAFNPYDNDSHGTHVAGLIWAEHNAQGVAGIAPYVIARAGRIFRGGWAATESKIAEVINWAWQSASSDVLNNSWGCGAESNAITAAIENARTLGRGGKGSVVVFAAGNRSGPVCYPAKLGGVLAVGTITRNGPRAVYSNFGPELDLVAPSGAWTGRCYGEVVTTDLWGFPGCNDGPAGGILDYTSTFSGTSAAAPQVAAVAALLLSTQPNLTEWQVRHRLCVSAISWGSANEYGCGKLDASRAVAPPPTVTITGASSVRPGATCGWSAAASGGIAPYSYGWWATSGSWTGADNEFVHTNNGSSFVISVTVGDAVSGTGTASKSVTVSASAPICQF